MKKSLLVLALAGLSVQAHALTTGDIAFTSFNADEDGLSFVTFVDITANTIVYFADNEWNGAAIGSGGAFNTGESYNMWNSGAATLAAGTVVRFSAYDKTTLSASVGSLSRVTVANSSNWGIANSTETLYAYLGSDATTPSTFLAAITNGSFDTDGSLANTGLTAGTNALRLNANATSATPDYAEYTGARSGETSFGGYKTKLMDLDNWTVDTSNGSYAATVPNTTAFSITPVPEPETYAMMLAGLGLVGWVARRRKGA